MCTSCHHDYHRKYDQDYHRRYDHNRSISPNDADSTVQEGSGKQKTQSSFLNVTRLTSRHTGNFTCTETVQR